MLRVDGAGSEARRSSAGGAVRSSVTRSVYVSLTPSGAW
jgi:hypothetical protein